MDDRSVRDEGAEVDLESGLAVIEDDSKNVSTPCNTKQGKTLFDKFCCGLVVGDSIKFSGVSIDMVKVTNKLLTRQDSVKCAENTPVKEKHKHKKSSNKKAAKPPRPPRSPSLDAADHKLIRELTELAMLKRARIERMKALKKMKAAKSSSSSSSSMFALIFTVVFCIVILLQGMSSGKSSVTSFQGSPVSAGGAEGDLFAVQHHFYSSLSDPNTPGLESHKIVQKFTGSDLPVN
ncbi:hypothetical protein SESBI_15595 [Sesbania bispinosa]|nr:hypothetical protein SESBI_15595 [Sesbania bispinosa]